MMYGRDLVDDMNFDEYRAARARLDAKYNIPSQDSNYARAYVKELVHNAEKYMILQHSPFSQATLHLYLIDKLPELDKAVLQWINGDLDPHYGWDEEKVSERIDEGWIYLLESGLADWTDDPWAREFKHVKFAGLWYVVHRQTALNIVHANNKKPKKEIEALLGYQIIDD